MAITFTFLDPAHQQQYRSLLPDVMTGTVVRWECKWAGREIGYWWAEIIPDWLPGDWRPPDRIRVGGEGRLPDACRDYESVRFQLLVAYEVRYPTPPYAPHDNGQGVVNGEWGLCDESITSPPTKKSQSLTSKEEGDG